MDDFSWAVAGELYTATVMDTISNVSMTNGATAEAFPDYESVFGKGFGPLLPGVVAAEFGLDCPPTREFRILAATVNDAQNLALKTMDSLRALGMLARRQDPDLVGVLLDTDRLTT